MFNDVTSWERLEQGGLTECASGAPEGMDEAAFQRLYARTAPRLWRYIRRVCGSSALADDIFQESFLRVLRLPRLRSSGIDGPYLYQVATHLIYDHWRRLQREKRCFSLAAVFRSRTQVPSQTAEELRLDVRNIFETLRPRERALLWLAYVDAYEHREIAQILGIKEKSVRVLLFRARKKMQRALNEK